MRESVDSGQKMTMTDLDTGLSWGKENGLEHLFLEKEEGRKQSNRASQVCTRR